MSLVAEYVSPGHPDRLCDQIVDRIVSEVVTKDKDALCGLECAVHTNKVFIDGRIAAGKDKPVITINDIKTIIKQVYKDAGYGKHCFGSRSVTYYLEWHPFPEELEIITDVCIETLSDEERQLRQYSDDQNVVNGYALNSPSSDYLPIEQYVALKIGRSFIRKTSDTSSWNQGSICGFGPDFKILVQIKREDDKYLWERLTLSVQHNLGSVFNEIYENAKDEIDFRLKTLFGNTELDSLSKIDDDKFYLNGAGDFIQGGPEGDNGLSGKKLCIDFYGPSIPIGGGAIFGKDPHKVDVCGALRARELAVNLVKKYGFYSVFTTLAWSPGEKAPYLIEAYEIDEFGTKCLIDNSLLPPKDFFSIECINNDLKLDKRTIRLPKDII